MMKYKRCILCTHICAPISLGIRLLTNMELSILCGIEDMSSNPSIANTISPFELQFSIPLLSVGKIVLEVLICPFHFLFAQILDCTRWAYKVCSQSLFLIILTLLTKKCKLQLLQIISPLTICLLPLHTLTCQRFPSRPTQFTLPLFSQTMVH